MPVLNNLVPVLIAAVIFLGMLWRIENLSNQRDEAVAAAHSQAAAYSELQQNFDAIRRASDRIATDQAKLARDVQRATQEIASAKPSNVCVQSEPVSRAVDWMRNTAPKNP